MKIRYMLLCACAASMAAPVLAADTLTGYLLEFKGSGEQTIYDSNPPTILIGSASGSVLCKYFGGCSFSISPNGTISGSYSGPRFGGDFSISFGDISIINAGDGTMHAASGYFHGGIAIYSSDVTIDRASVTKVYNDWNANNYGGGATITPLPEPASWALMIAGFGLLGAAMRRRKFALSYA